MEKVIIKVSDKSSLTKPRFYKNCEGTIINHVHDGLWDYEVYLPDLGIALYFTKDEIKRI